jgi:hypothetical protein
MVKIVLPLLIWGIIEIVIAIFLILVYHSSNLAIFGIGFFGVSSLLKLIYVAIANYL